MRKVRSAPLVVVVMLLLIGACFAGSSLGTSHDDAGNTSPGVASFDVDLPVVFVLVLGGLIILVRPRKRRVAETRNIRD